MTIRDLKKPLTSSPSSSVVIDTMNKVGRTTVLIFSSVPKTNKRFIKLFLVCISVVLFIIFGGTELFEAYTYSLAIRYEDETIKEDYKLFSENSCSAKRKLIGKTNVTYNVPRIDKLVSEDPQLHNGGHFVPKCSHNEKVAIIVPYRDRYDNLVIFIYNIHKILSRQLIEYQVFIIEQDDDEPFNRATLFNIGYVEALKLRNFTCFIFHDVDLIPEDDRNIYKCPTMPRHMSILMSNFNYKLPYHQFFGGVVAISRQHYEEINGCSNRFWGWGGEDDDFYNRVRNRGLIVHRYSKQVGRYTMLTHKIQTRMASRKILVSHVDDGRLYFKTSGLSDLKYKLVTIESHELFTWIKTRLSYN